MSKKKRMKLERELKQERELNRKLRAVVIASGEAVTACREADLARARLAVKVAKTDRALQEAMSELVEVSLDPRARNRLRRRCIRRIRRTGPGAR